MVFSYSSVFYNRELMNGLGHLSMIIIFSFSILITTQTAYAQVDILIDCDGIAPGAMAGCNTSQEVTAGDPLTPFPTGIPPGLPGVPRAGIDWFDRDGSLTWTNGDDLHSEDPDTCPTSNRDGFHDDNAMFFDCVILDLDNNFPDGIPVDCDLETGGSPSGIFPTPPPPCQDTRANVQITFFDSNSDGFWNDGEDIVLDFNGNLIFDPPMAVGGKFLDVDKTALVLAGTQFTSSWVIPTLVAAIGFGLVIARKI